MASHWTLTVRNGPRVERVHFDTLTQTLDALKHRLDELAPDAGRRAVQFARRRYDPARQVAVRAELTGPGGPLSRSHGGVDLRGDGSAEAYTGRIKRRLVDLLPGETPYAALRRALDPRADGD
ncbi:MAG TPA: hypothetical protein VGI76_06790 [Solirubrobacteraceae bacterium]|jgi:hypothetical protein